VVFKKEVKIKIIYEDDDVLVVDKPAGIVVFSEEKGEQAALIDLLLEKYPYLKDAGNPPRYGVVHRLDKDTSGIVLVAKNNKALIFFQKQFKKRDVKKKYIVLAIGSAKRSQGEIKTLIGRAPKERKKQKVYLPLEPNSEKKREAVTEYKIIKKVNLEGKNYSLFEVFPKTGRKHQIRVHFAYLGCPIAGDKIYGFKGQPCPQGLKRQFLHASYLKISLPSGEVKEFKSELPEDLKKVLFK